MQAYLPPKTITKLLLLLGIIALILLASGLSDFDLKPGRAFAISSPDENSPLNQGVTYSIPAEIIAGIITGTIFLTGLIAIFIRFMQGKEAIKEELIALFLFTIFVLFFTYLLSDAISNVDPEDLAVEATGDTGLDMEGLIAEAESNPITPPTFNPSDGFVLAVGVGVTLGAVAVVYFGYRRFWSKPAAATLDQLAISAEETLFQLQVEDANLRNVVMRSYYDMNRTVSEQGVKRAEGMTPREFEARLIQTGLPHRDVERLTRLFEEVRYGHAETGEGQKREAIACMEAIVAAAKRRATTPSTNSSPIASNRAI